MRSLGYVFKKGSWMEVQAPGFRYYHSLVKIDEMFAEDRLRHHVDMLERVSILLFHGENIITLREYCYSIRS